jgi:endonuclease/exonuclease/phosphatase family metal-dependent hydrolase
MRFLLFAFLIPTLAMSQSLKVMTYNIRFDNLEDGVNRWELRKEKVGALLAKYDADVIGVQEALHHQLTDLLQALPQYEMVGAGRDDGGQKGEYSALLYKKNKFRIIDGSTHWLSGKLDEPGTKGWDAALPRIFTVAVMEWVDQKKSIVIVNTHFDHVGVNARANSPRLILAYTRGLRFGATRAAARPLDFLPVVVMGNLNSDVSDPGYTNFLKPERDLTLVDCRPAQDTRGTYCTFQVGVPCRLIDYIFHSEEWMATDYQVIQDNDGTHYPSDHLPVLTTLQLKPK